MYYLVEAFRAVWSGDVLYTVHWRRDLSYGAPIRNLMKGPVTAAAGPGCGGCQGMV